MVFEPTPKWSFRPFAESTHRFYTPTAPCLFWRITQHLILGFVWERLEEPNDWPHRLVRVMKVALNGWGLG